MAEDHKFTEREQAMIEAYRAGKKVTAIEAEFKVGRSTLYHVLRRSGVVPSRTRSQVDAASGDARLAGIAELVAHQDGLIEELRAQVATLQRENAALRKKIGHENNGPSSSRTRKRTG
jgi:transposase